MALAFNPNRTFFRGMNKYKQIHPFIGKKRGEWEESRKKAGKLQPIKVSILETIGGYEQFVGRGRKVVRKMFLKEQTGREWVKIKWIWLK